MNERRSALRLAAGTGALHAVLFLLAYWLLGMNPGLHAPDAELVDFYASEDRRRLVLTGAYVMPFAGIAFLWFCTSLRAWLRAGPRRPDEVVAGLQLASGILYVALFFAGAAAASAFAVSAEHARGPIDPLLARQLPQLGQILLIVFGMRMAAMFVFTTSRLVSLTGLLPRWFALAGVVVGLFLLLSTSLDRRLVLVFPLWLLVLCALLVRRQDRGDGPEL